MGNTLSVELVGAKWYTNAGSPTDAGVSLYIRDRVKPDVEALEEGVAKLQRKGILGINPNSMSVTKYLEESLDLIFVAAEGQITEITKQIIEEFNEEKDRIEQKRRETIAKKPQEEKDCINKKQQKTRQEMMAKKPQEEKDRTCQKQREMIAKKPQEEKERIEQKQKKGRQETMAKKPQEEKDRINKKQVESNKKKNKEDHFEKIDLLRQWQKKPAKCTLQEI